MGGSKMTRDIRRTGSVTDIGWDDTVGAPQVAIECESGELLAVEMDAIGLELADHVDEDVSVTGTVWYDDLGNRWLRVSRYGVLFRRWEQDDELWVDSAEDDLDWDSGQFAGGASGTWH